MNTTAAYIKYGQTVPLKYAIAPDNCIFLTKGKYGVCAKVCPTGAIDHGMKAKTLKLNVGAVILAPGFKPFSPYYGYDTIPDVVTSLEYERMLSASGPSMGHLEKASNGGEPKKTAWIQCVGSRNTNCTVNGYCSSVCCMYAIKQAVMTRSHMTDGDGEQTIFYMDIRSPGKEYERYYESARGRSVSFVRARPHTLTPGPDGHGVTMTWVEVTGTTREEFFDMVVFSIGLEAPSDAKELAQACGIELDHYGFTRTSSFDPAKTSREGIYVTGSFQIPKAIPQSVAIASNATSPFVDLFKCSVNADGFLMEAHPKLKPVDSTVDGVFLAGMCHYPKPIDEAIAQGRAAASRASVILSKKTMKLDAIKSNVTHNCDGCALCLDICPYSAIELVEYRDDKGKSHRRIKTNNALCKGCGICAATCPKEGVVVNGFTLNQLHAQVDAILETA